MPEPCSSGVGPCGGSEPWTSANFVWGWSPIVVRFFLRLQRRNPPSANIITTKTTLTDTPTLTASEVPDEPDEPDEAAGDVLVVVGGMEVLDAGCPVVSDVLEELEVVCAMLKPLTGIPKTVIISDCTVEMVSVKKRFVSSWYKLRNDIVSPGLTVDIH